MKKLVVTVLLALAVLYAAPAAGAAELITNGGFETGTFTGWTATNASNFWMGWSVVGPGFDSGGFFPVTAPPQGTREAYQGTAANAGSPFTLDQTITIPAGTASISWRHRYRVDLFTYCTTVATCGTVTYSVQILNTSNVLLQTLYTRVAPALAMTDTGWQYNLRNLNAYAGQTIKIRFTTVATFTWGGPGQLEIDAVSVQSPGVVTAADATLSGRVTDADGQPISGATVVLTDGPDERTTLTNPFGYYNFTEVETGHTVVIAVSTKRYSFPNNPVAVMVTGDLNDLDFQASP